jgi:hypothetical protein
MLPNLSLFINFAAYEGIARNKIFSLFFGQNFVLFLFSLKLYMGPLKLPTGIAYTI